MNLVFIFSVLQIFHGLFGCTDITHVPMYAITKITVRYSLPAVNHENENLVDSNGQKLIHKVVQVSDSFSVYYYNDYTLYEINNHHIFQTRTRVDSIKNEFMYLLQKKGTSYCISFDAFADKNFVKKNLDSSLNSNAFGGGVEFYISPSDLLIREFANNDSTEITKVYSPKVKTEEQQYDSIYYFFNTKLKGIDFSLSKLLDKSTGSKLCKVEMLYSENKTVNGNKASTKKSGIEIIRKDINEPAKFISFIEENKKLFID